MLHSWFFVRVVRIGLLAHAAEEQTEKKDISAMTATSMSVNLYYHHQTSVSHPQELQMEREKNIRRTVINLNEIVNLLNTIPLALAHTQNIHLMAEVVLSALYLPLTYH